MKPETETLSSLKATGNLRTMSDIRCEGAFLWHDGKRYINLSSNDYLGLSSRVDLQAKFLENIDRNRFLMSNPSSRLMTGNSLDYNTLETSIAHLFDSEAALVLSSGYLLNSSLLRAIIGSKNDLILADKLVHSSIIDGLKLCGCRWERFAHNDMTHLRRLLENEHNTRIIVVAESLYSMDGDHAPLSEIAMLQQEFGFELALDEAHAFGVYGAKGQGVASSIGNLKVDYLVATMGKALASQGAFVVCSKERKELLINKLKSVIFSTALPPISLQWSQYMIELLPTLSAERAHLQQLISMMGGVSQIIPIMAFSNEKALNMAENLRQNGFWATAIRQPTVPAGTERLRISLTAAHTTQQINELCKKLG